MICDGSDWSKDMHFSAEEFAEAGREITFYLVAQAFQPFGDVTYLWRIRQKQEHPTQEWLKSNFFQERHQSISQSGLQTTTATLWDKWS
jgi:hypothetical protein